MTDEPAPATSVLGAALLAGTVLLFVHAATSALLTVLAITLTPGPAAPGGLWDVPLWLGAVVAGALSTVPVLRRVRRPLATGVVTGALAGAGYVALSVGLAVPGEVTPGLGARLASFVLAGAAAGALVARRRRR